MSDSNQNIQTNLARALLSLFRFSDPPLWLKRWIKQQLQMQTTRRSLFLIGHGCYANSNFNTSISSDGNLHAQSDDGLIYADHDFPTPTDIDASRLRTTEQVLLAMKNRTDNPLSWKLGTITLLVASDRWHWVAGWETTLKPGKDDALLRQFGQKLLEVERPEDVVFGWYPLFSKERNLQSYDPQQCVLFFARLRDMDHWLQPLLKPKRGGIVDPNVTTFIDAIMPAELPVLASQLNKGIAGSLIWTGLTTTSLFLVDPVKKIFMVRHLPFGLAHMAHALAEVDFSHVSEAIGGLASSTFAITPQSILQSASTGCFWHEWQYDVSRAIDDLEARKDNLEPLLIRFAHELKRSINYFVYELQGGSIQSLHWITAQPIQILSDLLQQAIPQQHFEQISEGDLLKSLSDRLPAAESGANLLQGISPYASGVLKLNWQYQPCLALAAPLVEQWHSNFGLPRSSDQESSRYSNKWLRRLRPTTWLQKFFPNPNEVGQGTASERSRLSSLIRVPMILLPCVSLGFLLENIEQEKEIHRTLSVELSKSRHDIRTKWQDRHFQFTQTRADDVAEIQFPMTQTINTLSQAIRRETPFHLTSVVAACQPEPCMTPDNQPAVMEIRGYKVTIAGKWEPEQASTEPSHGYQVLLDQLNNRSLVFGANQMVLSVVRTPTFQAKTSEVKKENFELVYSAKTSNNDPKQSGSKTP
ncbi:MAG: hypothetical protein H7836_15940 [Magnetococcus sp. YQC-3]